MKKLITTLILLYSVSFNSQAQNVHFGNSAHTAGWFRLGSLTLAQGGADAYIQIIAGWGYNAQNSQNGECNVHFRTSNGNSNNNGFYGAGSFYNTGRSKVVSAIKIIQIDLAHWELYAALPTFTGDGSLLSIKSVSGEWQSSFSRLDPPSNTSALDLTEELMVLSNTFYDGNVGIGTTTPNEKLAVNGNIRAKEIKVETSNWPDYVFEEDYKIISLVDLEKYIKTNKHLPDMPSAKEIESNGLELGEMNKALLKKVEELTLHLIDKDKDMESYKQALIKQNDKIMELQKQMNKLLNNRTNKK